MTSWRTLTLTLSAVIGAAAPAYAQIGQYAPPQVNPRPTISPYLNIMRNRNPAINYYGIVRPQLEANRQFQTLQTEISQLQGAPLQGAPLPPSAYMPLATQPPAAMAPTGHPVAFMNTAQYFGSMGRGGSSPVAGSTGVPAGYANPASALRLPVLAGLLD